MAFGLKSWGNLTKLHALKRASSIWGGTSTESLPVTQSGDTVKIQIYTEFFSNGTKTPLVDFYSQAAPQAVPIPRKFLGCIPEKSNSSDKRVKVALT
jgi:hypothetical protein